MSSMSKVSTAIVNRFGHRGGRRVAHICLSHPWIKQMILKYPDEAKVVGEFLAGGADILHIDGDGLVSRFVNKFIDTVPSEGVDRIESILKNPDAVTADAELKKFIHGSIDEHLAQPVYVHGDYYFAAEGKVGDTEYRACVHGFERPRGNKGQPASKPYTRREAIEAGKIPCPKCYGTFLKEILPEKKDEAASKPSGPSLIELVNQLRAEDPTAADAFWASYCDPKTADDFVKDKFHKVFGPGRGGTFEKFKIIAALPANQWGMALDTMIGSSEEKVEGIIRTIMAKIEKKYDGLADRFGEEGEEMQRTLGILHGMLDRRFIETPEKKRARAELLEELKKPSAWRTFVFAIVISNVVAWSCYALTRTNNDGPERLEMYEKMEVSNGR